MESRMRATTPRSVAVLTLPFHDPGAVPCPSCSEALSLCQPDPECPDRLVGTCPGCGAWYLVVPAQADTLARAVSLLSILKRLEQPKVSRRQMQGGSRDVLTPLLL